MRWIKLYTNLEHSEVFQDAGLWQLFTLLLTKACFERTVVRGIGLERGQCLFHQEALADMIGCGRRTVVERLKCLETLQCISRKSYGDLGTLLTIVNYDKYQDEDEQNIAQMQEIAQMSAQSIAQMSEQNFAHLNKNNIKTEKESVTFARTWEAELVGDQIWKEQLAMRLHVGEDVVVKGIREATQTFILDGQIPPDRQNYRLRTRQYIDSHLATIIRPTAEKVNEQINRQNELNRQNFNNPNRPNYGTGNKIDDHARELRAALQSTYNAIRSGAFSTRRDT